MHRHLLLCGKDEQMMATSSWTPGRNRVPSVSEGPRAGRFASLQREISVRRAELLRQWHGTGPADRIFSVERLLREGIVDVAVEQQLRVHQDRVRAAWVNYRVRKALSTGGPADAQVAALALTVAERGLFAYLDGAQLIDMLFRVAEGYLCAVPLPLHKRSFRALGVALERLSAESVHILPPIEDGAWGAA